MGSISSVSLPSGLTCRNDCECSKKCYAKRIERLRKNVRESYATNLRVLKENPDVYWREVEASIMMSRFFRFHVSGDIPDRNYLDKIIEVSDRNRHCEILCFTKKYELVNQKLDELSSCNIWLPENLHLVFSVWRGLKVLNPYALPEAHVRYKDGTTTARDNAMECGGNCTDCAIAGAGCWTLKKGEQVVFNEH
jgi:hypothetical protein